MYNKNISSTSPKNNVCIFVYGFKWMNFTKLPRQLVKCKSSDNMCGLPKTSAKN